MKIKLTPEMSYVIGLWKLKKTTEGIGISGNENLRTAFIKGIITAKLTTSDKIQIDRMKVFFYHTAYRKYFQDILKEQEDKFKYHNEYSKAFLAGLYDAKGGESRDKKFIYIVDADKHDEMTCLRLGFKVKLFKKQLLIANKNEFLAYIGKYRKMDV
ncbi:MAG: hypothetical protein WC356_00200 [Candidatus Micrarchaeia archaeon]|jgi:hypothetical protein